VIETPADDPAEHRAPAADAAADPEPAAPAPAEPPGPEGPPVVLTTDIEAQTDDPLINPNNS